MPERPIGITVLAILAGLFGIGLIILGVIVGALASVISDVIKANAPVGAVGVVDFTAIFTAVAVAIAVIMFIFGILHIAVAYGFWIGAGWSRMLAIILSILGIILGLISLPGGIVIIIIYGVILWYLMQRHVKAFFGAAPPPMPPPVPPP